MFFMAIALNRVDFLKSFDDALVDHTFKEFTKQDLEFLFWYRAIECQTERLGYLKELINWNEKYPFPTEDTDQDNANHAREIFCDLTKLEKDHGIPLIIIEDNMNTLCDRIAKGDENFSKVSIGL